MKCVRKRLECLLARHRPPKPIVLCQIEERLVVLERTLFIFLAHDFRIFGWFGPYFARFQSASLPRAAQGSRVARQATNRAEVASVQSRPGQQWGGAACPAGGACWG